MQAIQQFPSWFSKQKLSGKLAIGCASLFMLCCMCSFPMAVLNPSTSSTQTIESQIYIEKTIEMTLSVADTQAVALFSSTHLPTLTLVPSPENTQTATPIPTPTTLGASCIPNNPPQTGKVVDVVDGDTIKVLLDEDGRTYTVRYIGMNAPGYITTTEYFGAEAAIKNVQLVFGKNITLIKDMSEKDDLGRLLRYVIADNIFVNYELVVQGYANTVSSPPDIACIPTFEEAEQKASTSKLGVWNTPPTHVVAPTSSGGAGGNAICNCGGPDLNCTTDFSSQASAQACHDYCKSQGFGDIFGLDGNDNDGLACESLP